MVAIFYLASWQLGAVEAISLSILVGTSVDYCVHLVEGYIMAGNSIPNSNSAKVCLKSLFCVPVYLSFWLSILVSPFADV